MENKEDDIENLFKDRFENDEAPVSPVMWQNIKATLPKEPSGFRFIISPNIVLWSLMATLFISTVVGSFIYFHIKSAALNPNPSSTETTNAYHSGTSASHDRKTKAHSQVFSDSFSLSNKENKKHAHTDLNAKSNSSLSDAVTYNGNKNAFSSSREKQQANQSNISPVSDNNKTLPSTKNNEGNIFGFNSVKNSLKNKTNAHASDSVIQNNSSINLKIVSEDNLALNKQKILSSDQNKKDNESISENNRSVSSLDNDQKLRSSVKADTVKDEQSFASKNQLSGLDSTAVKSITNSDSSLITHSTNISDKNSADIGLNANSQKQQEQKIAITNSTISDSSELSALNGSSDSLLTVSKDSLPAIDSAVVLAKDSLATSTENKKAENKSELLRRFSFDLVGSALITGAVTKSLSNDSSYQAAVEDKNKNDKNSFGYSAGVIINYNLNPRIKLSAGILYTTFSEQYNFNYTLKKLNWQLVDSTWQSVESDSISRDIKVKDRYSFISVPLQVSYTFITKEKFRFSFTAGIRSNILLSGVTYLANERKTDVVAVKSGFNSISFSYLLALEAEYKLTGHTALLVQPVFLYGASSIHNKASGLNQKPYGIGLTLGLRFIF